MWQNGEPAVRSDIEQLFIRLCRFYILQVLVFESCLVNLWYVRITVTAVEI